MTHSRSVYRIFVIPLLIFIAGMLGLVSALLFDNGFDLVASIAVGFPIIIVAWIVFRARGKRI